MRVGDRLFVSPAATVAVTPCATHTARWLPVIGGKQAERLAGHLDARASTRPARWPWTAAAARPRSRRSPSSSTPSRRPSAGRWGTAPRSPTAWRPTTSATAGACAAGAAAATPPATPGGRWPASGSSPSPGSGSGTRNGEGAQFPADHGRQRSPAGVLRRARDDPRDRRQGGGLGQNRILWVAAEDAGAGVDRLTFRTRAEGDRVMLEIEAQDLVGNVSRQEIALRKGGG